METNWLAKESGVFVDSEFGDYEGDLANPETVSVEADQLTKEIDTPMDVSPEVKITGGAVLPQWRKRYRKLATNDEVAARVDQFADYKISATIQRQPNHWDVAGNIKVYAPGAFSNTGLVSLWQPRIGRSKLTVINTGANSVQVAPTQDKLVNGRGLTIAAGSSYDFETEAGGWALSTDGTVVDVVDFWYSDAELQPPYFQE